MASIIRDRTIVGDSWRLLDSAAEAAVAPDADVIVPLRDWLDARADLAGRTGRTGVLLDGGDDPARLAGDLAALPLVAIRFASFGDGRGYSLARLLRERFGFRGELRAIGHVERDQLAFMARCGFDAFVLRESQSPEQALSAFHEFSESYQGAWRPVEPLFRRREAA